MYLNFSTCEHIWLFIHVYSLILKHHLEAFFFFILFTKSPVDLSPSVAVNRCFHVKLKIIKTGFWNILDWMSALRAIQRFTLVTTLCCCNNRFHVIVINPCDYLRRRCCGFRSLTLSSPVAVISSDSDLTLIKICLPLNRFSLRP